MRRTTLSVHELRGTRVFGIDIDSLLDLAPHLYNLWRAWNHRCTDAAEYSSIFLGIGLPSLLSGYPVLAIDESTSAAPAHSGASSVPPSRPGRSLREQDPPALNNRNRITHGSSARPNYLMAVLNQER